MRNRLLSVFIVLTMLPGLTGCAGLVVGGVAAGALVLHDRRSPRTILDDQAIESRGAQSLRQHQDIKEKTHINITSYNRIVLLSGETPDRALKKKAGDIISSMEMVRMIHNELSIAAPSSIASRSSDSGITGKVKSSLLGIKDIKGFDGTRVKVVTANSVVFLMGIVTRQEGDAATETARRVGGVQRVVKLFEYTD